MVEWLNQRVMHRPFVNEGAGTSNGLTWKEQDERDVILKAREDDAKVKVCARCGLWKPLGEFYKNKRAKDGLRIECKDCGKSQAKKWAKENKKRHYTSVKKYRGKKRKWYEEYKSNIACKVCGENHSACLEFHHRNPDEKDFPVSYMVETQSIRRLMDEMKKCDVFCSNCHKKLHYDLRRNI